jgi:hypothetical protein
MKFTRRIQEKHKKMYKMKANISNQMSICFGDMNWNKIIACMIGLKISLNTIMDDISF